MAECGRRPRRLTVLGTALVVALAALAGSLVASGTPSALADPLQCSPGSYSTTGLEPCVPADPGHYVDQPGATAQQECGAGTYAASTGQDICDDAPPGTYVPSTGATGTVNCSVGTYAAQSGASACSDADPGHYVDVEGSATQEPCLAGSSASGSASTSCVLAPAGSYVSEDGAFEPVLCESGSYSSADGAELCTLALAGSYATGPGATEPTECAAGTYSSANGAPVCTPAPLGSYVPATGATLPARCASGFTTIVIGATECIPDPTAPTVVASVTGGVMGSGGWYTAGPVEVVFEVDDPESDETMDGCSDGIVTYSTAGTTFTCSATSPGGTTTESLTVRLDRAMPVIVFRNNKRAYRVLDTVRITCRARDALSGLASTGCPRVVSSPGWTLKAGSNTRLARAKDKAGNVVTRWTMFTVSVTSADLCTLTGRFVTSSSTYTSADRATKRATKQSVKAACGLLPGKITPYRAAVRSLASARYLTTQQSRALKRWAGTL